MQMFYPEEYNGCWAACPDPIDFRAYTVVNIYKDENAYYAEGPFGRMPRPGHRNYLGHVSATLEDMNRLELVLGTQEPLGPAVGHLGGRVFAGSAPTAIRSGSGTSATGAIDRRSPNTGRSTTTSRYILQRDWARIGKKLEGKIHLYVGDMDNYYLNNAVYLMEDFLKRTKDPSYGGEVEVRRPRRALLERRPDAAERHLPAPLSPDVRAEDRRAAAEDGPARGRT